MTFSRLSEYMHHALSHAHGGRGNSRRGGGASRIGQGPATAGRIREFGAVLQQPADDWQRLAQATLVILLWALMGSVALAADEIDCDKAHALVSKSNFERNRETANAYLAEAVGICPGFIRPHELLGNYYRKAGGLDKAWEHFNWAANLGSHNNKLYYLMAEMAFDEGRLNQAAAYVRKSLDIRSDYEKAVALEKRINAASDRDGPSVEMIAPSAPDTTLHTDYRPLNITVRGIATDRSGVSRIMVNDKNALLSPEGYFTRDVGLSEGVNTIWIAAVDSAGNTTRRNFQVTVSPGAPPVPMPTGDSVRAPEHPGTVPGAGVAPANEKPAPAQADTEGPTVEIIEPAATRAISVTRRSNTLKVRGIATDPGGISRVLVNDREAPISGNGEFVLEVVLDEGTNTINIVAVDSAGNVTRREVMVSPVPDGLPEMSASALSPAAGDGRLYDKSVAVVIGINGYEYWPALSFAVNDALSVKQAMERMGFDKVIVILDKDATQRRILTAVGYELPRMVGVNDRVMIYFAGHGQTESLATGATRGYLIPVDGDRENYFATAISMETLRGLSARIPSKHILYIMDACYSGLGFNDAGGLPPSARDYLERLSGMRSVQMITAGGMNEQVIESKGHGLFTAYLLEAFAGAADTNEDNVITATELGAWLKPAVVKASRARQSPLYGRLEGEGDVLFPLHPAGLKMN